MYTLPVEKLGLYLEYPPPPKKNLKHLFYILQKILPMKKIFISAL